MTLDPSCSSSWDKEKISEFLERENLKYQKVDLPFGLSTAGNERDQMYEVAFGDRIEGQTVLDVGSYLGAFCIEALRRGASRTVGIELNSDRIRQARTIAEILDLPAEYIQTDIDNLPDLGPFDICLCLNILHHLRNPLSLLYKLTELTRKRLVVEIASLGKHDRKRLGLGFIKGNLLGRSDIVYVAEGTLDTGHQKFFFTPTSISRILDGHMKKYWDVRIIRGDLKNRFIVRADKLAIKRLTVVSGPSGSGKSSFIAKLKEGRYDATLGHRGFAEMLHTSAQKVCEQRLSDLLPSNPTQELIYHYDTTRLKKYNIHSFDRDIACDPVECADEVDFIIIAPKRSTLMRQMHASKVMQTRGKKTKLRKRIFELYEREGWIEEHYRAWFSYCDRVHVEKKRIHALVEIGAERELRPVHSTDELLKYISQ